MTYTPPLQYNSIQHKIVFQIQGISKNNFWINSLVSYPLDFEFLFIHDLFLTSVSFLSLSSLSLTSGASLFSFISNFFCCSFILYLSLPPSLTFKLSLNHVYLTHTLSLTSVFLLKSLSLSHSLSLTASLLHPLFHTLSLTPSLSHLHLF